MVIALGSLVVRLRAVGAAKAAAQVSGFAGKFSALKDKIGPQLANLTKRFGQFGLIASGVFGAMIASSPRLRAQMAMMGLQASRLVRIFADALVPVFKAVTNAIKELFDWFTSLPQPVQDAIVFGVALATVLGLMSVAFGVLMVAASPVTLIFLALIALAAALHLAFSTNFLGFQDLIVGIFSNITGIFQGFIDFISAIFRGDLEGALTAIWGIFTNIADLIVSTIWFIPQAFLDILDFLTGGLVGQFIDAGAKLIEGFLAAIAGALSAATGFVGDLLQLIADFFGGSLPRRGPLKNIVGMGEDLGVAYVRGVGTGINQSTSRSERNLNIRNLSLNLTQAPRDSRSLLRQMDSDLRSSNSW